MSILDILNSFNGEGAIQYHAYSLLHDKIAELEAENAELKKEIFESYTIAKSVDKKLDWLLADYEAVKAENEKLKNQNLQK